MSLDRPQAQSFSTPAPDQILLPILAIVAGAVALRVSPAFVRPSDVGPLASASWRVALALPLLWVWMRWDTGSATGCGTLAPGGYALAPMVTAGILFAGDLVFWHL